MMFPSHLLATVLVGLGLSRLWRPFQPRDWLLALAFGVVIDLDHLLHLPAYLLAHGAAGLDPSVMLSQGSLWQGVMHTPWALAVVLPVCALCRSALPLAFWGLHMVQDFVIARHFVHFGGPVEWVLVGLMLGLAAAILRAQHRRTAPHAPFLGHVAARLGLFPLAMKPFRRR